MAGNNYAELTEFVEKMGVFGIESGMPRSVARVLGFLLICEPAYQSADQIADKLKLSAGAVSNAVNLLQQARLLKRVTFAGDRRYYYEFNPDGWKESLITRLKTLPRGIELAAEGLKISRDNPRLEHMRDFYQVLSVELDALMARLDKM